VQAASATTRPPLAAVREVSDEYFGVKVVDPYRYMEKFTDPDVQTWVRGQADYAASVLKRIEVREALLKRISELDEGAPYTLSVVRRWPTGDLHYLKRLASENLNKLYFRPAGGEEKVLVDPEKLKAADGPHVSIEFVSPSPDKRYVAYGLAEAGSEQTTLHVLDTTTMKDLPETIDRIETAYNQPSWLADGSAFLYARRRKLSPSDAETEEYKKTAAYVHKLGTDVDSDAVVFSMDATSRAPMTETDFPSIALTAGSDWMIGRIQHGDTSEVTLYSAPAASLTAPAEQIPWRKICDAKDEVTEYTVHADHVYLMTGAGSPRYRVVRTSLEQPSFSSARTIMPMGSAVVHSIGAAKDAVYVGLLEGASETVVRVPHDAADGAQPELVELSAVEPNGYVESAEPDVDGVLIETASWTRQGRTYAFDPIEKKLTDTGLTPRGKLDDVPGYEAHEVMVTSHDGVKVPLSIIHKSGLKRDGSNPTLASGYGAYGHCQWPYFSPSRLAWLERGGVIAIAHVRGGGEYGREWHFAGRMATKPNTWKDFIACCEYLVREKYTSPEKLAGQGGSAGGILIGRAITERPELFAAAVINVGVSDALRMETTTNGVPNIKEFGTVTTREGFEGLYAMSSYAHVKDGVRYPAVLLTHGINDPRVEPWMSAKMTGRLQAATASDRPVLFRVDYEAGHGVGSTKRQGEELRADEWAFLLWQMGEASAETE